MHNSIEILTEADMGGARCHSKRIRGRRKGLGGDKDATYEGFDVCYSVAVCAFEGGDIKGDHNRAEQDESEKQKRC